MGVLAALGTVVLPLAVNSVGMVRFFSPWFIPPGLTLLVSKIVATSITGSFLVFLGVDLFVNSVNGLSLALVCLPLLPIFDVTDSFPLAAVHPRR